MIKIVALDFDGVIMDGAHEVFVACQKVLEERNQKLEDSAESKFRMGRNLLRAGKDLYGIIELFKQGVDFNKISQKEFDDFVKENEEESKKFSKDFFAMREKMIRENFNTWLSLNRLYSGIKDSIEKLSKKFHVVTISNKYFNSIAIIFEKMGIGIDKDDIFSKEISENKVEQIKNISKKFSVNPEEIFFIDDMPKHVEDVKELGLNVALAGWGYNNDMQKEEVRQLEIPVIDKPEDIEKEIKRLNEK